MLLATQEVILSGNINFTLYEDGDLTLRFRADSWPLKLTDVDATRLSQALETMLRKAIQQQQEDGTFFISRPPTLELRTPLANRS